MATVKKNGGSTQSFQTLATRASNAVGSKWGFSIACATIVLWIVMGPSFRYSDTWQLVINTATTIVTFLMVFLIQNSQNRDARAIHLKLDEIIRSIQLAHNDMINIEKLSDEELEVMAKRYDAIRAECLEREVERRRSARS